MKISMSPIIKQENSCFLPGDFLLLQMHESRQPADVGEGVHNTLRVQVCAAHMDGLFSPKFSNKGPFSADFPETCVDLPEIHKI